MKVMSKLRLPCFNLKLGYPLFIPLIAQVAACLFGVPLSVAQTLSSPTESGNSLCASSRLTTVKVFGGGFGHGSGILVHQQGDRYTILTNEHVIHQQQERYIIETHDGNQHQARLVHNLALSPLSDQNLDIVVLEFESTNSQYPIATLNHWRLGQQVFAAGFPTQQQPDDSADGYFCTDLSDVSRRLPEAMEEGYQLGFYSSIRNGMSGGPLLNDQGEVIGINGRGIPAIVNPDVYQYQDGRRVPEALALLSSSSWAIPIPSVIHHPLLATTPLTLANASPIAANQSAQNSPTLASDDAPNSDATDTDSTAILPSPASTSAPAPSFDDLQTLAQQSVVLVTRRDPVDGYLESVNTGLIYSEIAQTSYLVLTAGYFPNPEESFIIRTNDNVTHHATILNTWPLALENIDSSLELAVLTFRSPSAYRFISISDNDTDLTQNYDENVYTAAWVDATGDGFVQNLEILPRRVESQNLSEMYFSNVLRAGFQSSPQFGIVFDHEGDFIGIQLTDTNGIRTNAIEHFLP